MTDDNRGPFERSTGSLRCFAVIVIALLVAPPTAQAGALSVSAAIRVLFLRDEEQAGITLPFSHLRQVDAGLVPLKGACNPFSPEFIGILCQRGPNPNAFTTDSLLKLGTLSQTIEREHTRTRLRPFLASWVYDTSEDSFVVADEFLGPMLAERAPTLGKGRMALGFSYQQANFDRIRGENLRSIKRTIVQEDFNGDGMITGAETDVIDLSLSLELQQKYIDFFLEYGLTNDIDLGIAFPLIVTELRISGEAFIVNDPALFDPGQSAMTNFFCRRRDNKVPVVLDPGVDLDSCPAGNTRGDRAEEFQGPLRDNKRESAIGIGDVRVRAKWHAMHRKGWIPDLSIVSEIKPPTGTENDLQGTGALSFLNYIVLSHQFWRISPHLNGGIEWSTGPDWQDAVEWIAGVDLRVTDWLGISVDQMSRIPFGDEVDERYEFGVGAKFVPALGLTLFVDAIFPLNKSAGLQADVVWRTGLLFQF